MITDLWVVATGDALLLDVPAPLAASLAARLDSLIFAEDVQVSDVSAEMTCVHLLGPAARVAAPPLRCYQAAGCWCRTPVRGAWLVAYGALDAVLADNGLHDDLGPALEVDLDTLDAIRIEAGVPRFLVDMTEETIPLEAGIEDRAISFTKGCYVGQEVIVRVTTRGGGRVARRLVGLRLDRPAARRAWLRPRGARFTPVLAPSATSRARPGRRRCPRTSRSATSTAISWSPGRPSR